MPGPGLGTRMCANVALVTVCVIGATGDLGGRVVTALRAQGADVQGLARRPHPGCVIADLADPASLRAAFAGVERVFLVSSPTEDQVALETNAIEAAERAGVQRIVKVSNIPIAALTTGLHGNHRAIERRLAASPVASTVLQPSFFTTVIDKQRDLVARGKLVLPTGSGRIAWIDPRDIADVAAEALLRDDHDGSLHLTGPEALDADEVAARLGVRRLDPPVAQWRDAAVAGGLDPWLADSTVHLYEAVARGALAEVTDTVPRVLGRPATPPFERSGAL
jgi:NAD(P)H dehydrogenase (quinone)